MQLLKLCILKYSLINWLEMIVGFVPMQTVAATRTQFCAQNQLKYKSRQNEIEQIACNNQWCFSVCKANSTSGSKPFYLIWCRHKHRNHIELDSYDDVGIKNKERNFNNNCWIKCASFFLCLDIHIINTTNEKETWFLFINLRKDISNWLRAIKSHSNLFLTQFAFLQRYNLQQQQKKT